MTQGLTGYCKLRIGNLIALLSEQSSQEMPSEQSTQNIPTPPSRTRKYNGRLVHSVKKIPHPREMDKLEKQEIAKS